LPAKAGIQTSRPGASAAADIVPLLWPPGLQRDDDFLRNHERLKKKTYHSGSFFAMEKQLHGLIDCWYQQVLGEAPNTLISGRQ